MFGLVAMVLLSCGVAKLLSLGLTHTYVAMVTRVFGGGF